MRTVWKFPLWVNRWTTVAAGEGPVVLAAIDPQSGAPAVWIEHEVPYQFGGEIAPPPGPGRQFIVVGTGREIRDGRHVGSMVDRNYVWHVYEREPT